MSSYLQEKTSNFELFFAVKRKLHVSYFLMAKKSLPSDAMFSHNEIVISITSVSRDTYYLWA